MKRTTLALSAALALSGCSRAAQEAAVNAPRDLQVAGATRTACVGPGWQAAPASKISEATQDSWIAWHQNLTRCHAPYAATLSRLVPAWAPFAARETAEREALALGPYGRGEITTTEMDARSRSITARYGAVFTQLWAAQQATLNAAAQQESNDNAAGLAAASIGLDILSIGVGVASFAIPAPAPGTTILVLPPT